MNRWPGYSNPPAPFTEVDGGYEAVTPTGTNVGVSKSFTVVPGTTVRVGLRKMTLTGTPGKCTMYFSATGWALEAISAVEDGYYEARFVVPPGVTTLGGGCFIIASSSGAKVRLTDVVFAGGVDPDATKAKDQVTLQVLPTPNNVRLYYLKQASNLAAPTRPKKSAHHSFAVGSCHQSAS